jgi:hypothetical protein
MWLSSGVKKFLARKLPSSVVAYVVTMILSLRMRMCFSWCVVFSLAVFLAASCFRLGTAVSSPKSLTPDDDHIGANM